MANTSWFTPSPIGNGSLVTNGGLFPVPMSNAFYPTMATAPFYKGSGQPPPTVPINYMNQSTPQTSAAAGNPFSPTQSPLLIAVIALAIGLLGLRYVHWRG